MTERSEGIRGRAPVVTLSDVGGLLTERSTVFTVGAAILEAWPA
jgi:hypothetical protein